MIFFAKPLTPRLTARHGCCGRARRFQPVRFYDELAGMNDQFFLGEELERAVPFHVNGVSEGAFNRRKHGDNRASLMFVGCAIDLLANRKLRH
jgi:hypothetical protein